MSLWIFNLRQRCSSTHWWKSTIQELIVAALTWNETKLYTQATPIPGNWKHRCEWQPVGFSILLHVLLSLGLSHSLPPLATPRVVLDVIRPGAVADKPVHGGKGQERLALWTQTLPGQAASGAENEPFLPQLKSSHCEHNDRIAPAVHTSWHTELLRNPPWNHTFFL